MVSIGTRVRLAVLLSGVVLSWAPGVLASQCPLGTDPKVVASRMLQQWEHAHDQVIQRFGPGALSGSQGAAPFKAEGQYLKEAGYPTEDPDNHACLALVSDAGLDHVAAENLGLQLGGEDDYKRTVDGLRKFIDAK